MNYIVYDLEFNQKDPNTSQIDTTNASTLQFEIIQIGALKLDENFKTLSTFNALIKPTVHTSIHPYVENLTKINNEMINSSKTFTEVYKDFLKFIGNKKTTLCIWGVVDIKELIRNIKFHKLPLLPIPKYYIDIQQHASNYFNIPKGSKIGLKNAVDLLNLRSKNEFHDAFNDAYYTTEVFKMINNNDIKPQIYSPTTTRLMSEPREKVDNIALIKQFEKIYNRKMTQEEEGMIKLAYIMGKTKQFLK